MKRVDLYFLSFVRSGVTFTNHGSVYYFGSTGYVWASSVANYSNYQSALVYELLFALPSVSPSNGPNLRLSGFPLRCLAYQFIYSDGQQIICIHKQTLIGLLCDSAVSVPIFYLFKPKLCFHGSRVLCSALSQKGLNDRINTFKQQKSIQQLCMKHNHQNGTFIASGRKIWAHELLIMITKRGQIIDISVLI